MQTVFENMQACAAGRNNCAFTSVFCQTDPTRGYNWCPYNNGTVASFVPDPKGSAYMCPLGLTLPRNPVPCSTPGGEQSLGYALLRSLVQIYEVGNPKSPPNFFEKVGITGIRDLEQNRGVWNVSRLGGGEDGLGTDGVGNAENYAKFASLSWDYGYGGTPCPERWDEYAAANNLVPV